MNDESYVYDVAFSFLAQDEPLAAELNDLLRSRLTTFLYSKRQGEIAGTDGERTFNKVFAEEARIVVVLYRTGWGETPWTRIEQTAIRNRAFENGYDFVIFIPLDDPPAVPKWLPRTRLWIGLHRWGTSGAASVIEARVQEYGGEPREETVQDQAKRLARTMEFKERRNRFLTSDEGVSASKRAFEDIAAELQALVEGVSASGKSVTLTLKRSGRHIVVLGFKLGLSIIWRPKYANTLDDAELNVAIWDGHPPFPGIMRFDEPRQLNSTSFSFDILITEEHVWLESSSARRQYSSKGLAAYILKRLMDEGLKQNERR